LDANRSSTNHDDETIKVPVGRTSLDHTRFDERERRCFLIRPMSFQYAERKKSIAKGVSKFHPFHPSSDPIARAVSTLPNQRFRVVINNLICMNLSHISILTPCEISPSRLRRNAQHLPADCNPYMLFARPSASTPSSKSSKKQSATSRFSNWVGLTPPTDATRCWLHLLSSSAFAAILVAARESRWTVRSVAGKTPSRMHRRWI
jgi:hypothetical protein